MAVSNLKAPTNVKYATITGTPNQYGSLLYNDELLAIKDRIIGIVDVSTGGVFVNIMHNGNRYFFGCFKAYPSPSEPYTSSITIKVAYI